MYNVCLAGLYLFRLSVYNKYFVPSPKGYPILPKKFNRLKIIHSPSPQQHKSRPIKWLRVPCLQLQLRTFKSFGDTFFPQQPFPVKSVHKGFGLVVWYLPEAHQEIFSPGYFKGPLQAVDTFIASDLSQTGFPGRQYDQLRSFQILL